MTSHPVTIAVVDDEPLIRLLLAETLQEQGYEVSTVDSGPAFLDQLARGVRPSCILCDVRMPGMSGLELLKRLSEDQLGIPVIMVTGFADVEMAVDAMKAGAVDFVEKPFHIERIVAAVKA